MDKLGSLPEGDCLAEIDKVVCEMADLQAEIEKAWDAEACKPEVIICKAGQDCLVARKEKTHC